jgi:hypothetical protein
MWPSELDLMAEFAGLRLRERWGGWKHEPFGTTDWSLGVRTGGHMSRPLREPELKSRRASAPTGKSSGDCLWKIVDNRTLAR